MQSETFANWELQGVSLRWKSTRLEVFCKNSFLKDFAKFAEKHLRRSVFWGEQLHQKRDTPVFSNEFSESFITNFFGGTPPVALLKLKKLPGTCPSKQFYFTSTFISGWLIVVMSEKFHWNIVLLNVVTVVCESSCRFSIKERWPNITFYLVVTWDVKHLENVAFVILL